MNAYTIPRWLVGAIVVVSVPSIACFGFYTLDDVGEFGNRWPALVILAYPVALISLIVLVTTFVSTQHSAFRLTVAGICFTLPTLFLLLVRL